MCRPIRNGSRVTAATSKAASAQAVRAGGRRIAGTSTASSPRVSSRIHPAAALLVRPRYVAVTVRDTMPATTTAGGVTRSLPGSLRTGSTATATLTTAAPVMSGPTLGVDASAPVTVPAKIPEQTIIRSAARARSITPPERTRCTDPRNLPNGRWCRYRPRRDHSYVAIRVSTNSLERSCI
ncbi:hypothetical protein [Actinoallomurus acanthiterrae]